MTTNSILLQTFFSPCTLFWGTRALYFCNLALKIIIFHAIICLSYCIFHYLFSHVYSSRHRQTQWHKTEYQLLNFWWVFWSIENKLTNQLTIVWCKPLTYCLDLSLLWAPIWRVVLWPWLTDLAKREGQGQIWIPPALWMHRWVAINKSGWLRKFFIKA